MDVKLLHFLSREAGDAPRGAILAMIAVSGIATSLLLALVNLGAEYAADGMLKAELLIAYLIAFGIVLEARRFALTQSVMAVERAVLRFRLRVIDKIRRSDLRLIEQQGGMGAFAPLTQDTGLISQAVVVLVPVGESVLILVFTCAYLAWLSPASLLVALTVYGLMMPVYFSRFFATRDDLRRAAKSDASFFERFIGMLRGFKELKLNRRENDALFDHLRETMGDAFRLKLRSGEREAQDFIFANSIFYLVLLVLVFAIPAVLPEASSTVHKVIAAVLFMIAPIEHMVNGAPTLAKVDAAVTNLYDLEARLDRAAADADGPAPPETVDGFERIDLKALSFHYDDREGQTTFAVGPLDLTLQRGERLFIVGGNGSGKSTLLKLLTGLYRPEQGRILLDGRAIMAEDRPGYRSLFTSVFTDFHLFDRLYGIPDLDPTTVNAKLTDLELGHKTRYTDQGFSNLDLSTGQKKRLAFLASVLKERPICVFDELAADQDPQFRRRFYQQILPDLSALGRTLVVVSHDDQYFHAADRVLRVRDGQLTAIDRTAASGRLEP